MTLTTFTEPARVRKVGTSSLVLTGHAKLKIQTTGPGAQTLLDESAPAGKTWTVLITVEIKET